ncbi:hypothetical protein LINPERHAP1_LOCUS17936 [Linum perenne]
MRTIKGLFSKGPGKFLITISPLLGGPKSLMRMSLLGRS